MPSGYGSRSNVGAGDFHGANPINQSQPPPPGNLGVLSAFGQQMNPGPTVTGALGNQTPHNASSPKTLAASGDISAQSTTATGTGGGGVGGGSTMIMQRDFSPEIEQETNGYFMKIYNHNINPITAIDELP